MLCVLRCLKFSGIDESMDEIWGWRDIGLVNIFFPDER